VSQALKSILTYLEAFCRTQCSRYCWLYTATQRDRLSWRCSVFRRRLSLTVTVLMYDQDNRRRVSRLRQWTTSVTWLVSSSSSSTVSTLSVSLERALQAHWPVCYDKQPTSTYTSQLLHSSVACFTAETQTLINYLRRELLRTHTHAYRLYVFVGSFVGSLTYYARCDLSKSAIFIKFGTCLIRPSQSSRSEPPYWISSAHNISAMVCVIFTKFDNLTDIGATKSNFGMKYGFLQIQDGGLAEAECFLVIYMYRVAQKIVSSRALSISLLNIDQFSQFFHQ